MKPSKTFITSDHHFGHKNIISYEDRPFESVEAMTEEMIKRWNALVGKDDLVYHLGDFAFISKKEDLKALLARLNGRKILIMGNHDRFINKNPNWWREVGFEQVYPCPIIVDNFWILSHEPMYMNHHMPYKNLHGHIHGNKLNDDAYYNVCVEHTAYTPILIDDVKNFFMKIPI